MNYRTLLVLLLALPFAAPAASPVPAPGVAEPYNALGRADAPVAMVEFSDLQCPYCARYTLKTFPQIKRAYIDTGKVRYVVNEFPLPMHPQAVPAAVAARCAGEQGKYWEYRDAAYAGLSQFAPPTNEELAQKLGLDFAKFASCRSDPAQEAAVLESRAAGRRGDVNSTPTFFIGRFVDGKFEAQVIDGAKPYEEFAAMIDAALAGGQ